MHVTFFQSKKCLYLLFAIIFGFHINIASAKLNNECSTHIDYSAVWINPRCWYNPDVTSDTCDIAKRHGYKCEPHRVQTEDGYILTVLRVSGLLNDTTNATTKQPLIMFHGVLRDSRCWFLRDIYSPALYFANRFDVWVPSSRGSKDSSHISLKKSDAKFWNFSFHEMGAYDVPAVVDHIVNETGQSGKIIYVGHSLGTTVSYIYATDRKDHAEKHLQGIVSLGPAAKLKKLKSFVFHITAKFIKEIKFVLVDVLGIYAILANVYAACPYYPFNLVCLLGLYIITGYNNENEYAKYWPMISKRGQTAVAVKVLEHVSMLINKKGAFTYYDYGSEGNKMLYNSTIAPVYPLEKIRIPVHLIYANNDYITYKDDVEALYKVLTTTKSITEIPDEDGVHLNHIDFLIAKNMKLRVLDPLNDALNKIIS